MGQKFSHSKLEQFYLRLKTGIAGVLTRKQLGALRRPKPRKRHIGRRAFQNASRIAFWESTHETPVKFNY